MSLPSLTPPTKVHADGISETGCQSGWVCPKLAVLVEEAGGWAVMGVDLVQGACSAMALCRRSAGGYWDFASSSIPLYRRHCRRCHCHLKYGPLEQRSVALPPWLTMCAYIYAFEK